MNISTPTDTDARFATASDWFETIQRRIIEAMEALEREFADAGAEMAPGRFAIDPWARTDASGAPGGGGRMAILHGRLFEKMGAHTSVVHGAFPPEFAAQIPGADRDPALLGRRGFGDRPSLEPARADRAHEHPPRAHDQDLVRRRRGSHADAG